MQKERFKFLILIFNIHAYQKKTMKSGINHLTKFVLPAIILLVAFIACKKDYSSALSSQTKTLSVHLLDDPSHFDNVFIDIKYVEVKIDTIQEHLDNNDSEDADKNDNNGDDDHTDHDQYGKWDTLQMHAGIYDLARLRNGVDTLLGVVNIPRSKIRKIRLTTGDHNSVVVNGVTYPLLQKPGTNHYLYIKVKDDDVDESVPDHLSLWVDFNIYESIEEENGMFYLNPVLHAFNFNKAGKLEGKVFPADAKPLIKAYSSTDTAYAVPEEDGEYKITGLKEGTYDLYFKGSNGYKDTLVTGIFVKMGQKTTAPEITLKK